MPTIIAIWIWLCAYLNCAGWFLSAIHQLNAGGYVIALAIWFATLFVWRKNFPSSVSPHSPHSLFQKIFRRFRKPFPLAFLILTAMAFLGGAIYPPNNYDALAYRVPRILHWLADGRWHWIHTIFDRVNDRSCGIEWVSAPSIAIFKTDRFLFLINIISFLFLPGLIFSVFTRLGVRRRVAWHWMWILPTGYGFLLQAGSIGNDLFGAPFALAAVDFALRAKTSKSSDNFFISIFAAAMMTSAKTSSLPLLLPWAIAIFPSLKIILRKPLTVFVVCVAAVFASALPTMFLNQKFMNDWSGAHLSNGNVKHAIALKTGANIVLLTIENFVPPVFPWANQWNHAMDIHLPSKLAASLSQLIEWPGCKFHLKEMQTEEDGGLGFGVCMLLLASTIGVMAVKKNKLRSSDSLWIKLVRWSPLICLIAVLTQANLSALARVLVPYYSLLLPSLLVLTDTETLIKKIWWRSAALLIFIIADSLLIISPARPLFPALTILKKISTHHPNSKILLRMNEVYSVYRHRNDAFAPVRDILPKDLKILGLTTFDEPETSLWRPFGSREIVHVCPQDTPDYLKSRGVKYILVKDEMFGKWFPESLDNWLKKMNAQIIQKISLNLRAETGTTDWYLVKLN